MPDGAASSIGAFDGFCGTVNDSKFGGSTFVSRGFGIRGFSSRTGSLRRPPSSSQKAAGSHQPSRPGAGAAVKAARDRPAASSARIASDGDDFEAAEKRHNELVKLASGMKRSTPTFLARYEPRQRKGASWYHCQHSVQARLKRDNTTINKSFGFTFPKDGDDECFRRELGSALDKAEDWRQKEESK